MNDAYYMVAEPNYTKTVSKTNDLGAVGNGQWCRDELYISTLTNNTTFYKDNWVWLSLFSGPADTGYAGFDVYAYPTYMNTQKVGEYSASPSASGSHGADVSMSVLDIVQIEGDRYLPIQVTGADEFEVARDARVISKSGSTDPSIITERSIVENCIYYKLNSPLNDDDLVVEPPVILVPSQCNEAMSLSDNDTMSVKYQDEDWFTIEALEFSNGDMGLELKATFRATENLAILPRISRINVNNAWVYGNPTLHFDSNNEFMYGTFTYNIPSGNKGKSADINVDNLSIEILGALNVASTDFSAY